MTMCIQGVLNTNAQGTISQPLSLYILSPSSNASSRPECEIKKYESNTHDRPIEFLRYCCENLWIRNRIPKMVEAHGSIGIGMSLVNVRDFRKLEAEHWL